MEEKEVSKKEFTFQEVVKIIWNKMWLIVILAIIFGCALFVYSRYGVERKYSSSTMFIVNSGKENKSEQIQASEISANRGMAETYKVILSATSYFQDVVDALTYVNEETKIPRFTNEDGSCKYLNEDGTPKYNKGDMMGMISVSVVDETEVMVIKVVNNNIEDTQDIAIAAFNAARDKFNGLYNEKGGGVDLVDSASEASAVAKGTAVKSIVGALVGAVLGVVIAFVINMCDVKVHDGKSVSERYNIPLLAEISN